MSEFARRTGLSPAAQNQRRYLWADAFAVCNFLELFERTGDQQYSFSATPAGTSVSRLFVITCPILLVKPARRPNFN
jgi:hypothetical protein